MTKNKLQAQARVRRTHKQTPDQRATFDEYWELHNRMTEFAEQAALVHFLCAIIDKADDLMQEGHEWVRRVQRAAGI